MKHGLTFRPKTPLNCDDFNERHRFRRFSTKIRGGYGLSYRPQGTAKGPRQRLFRD
jgi:hypothetical protein